MSHLTSLSLSPHLPQGERAKGKRHSSKSPSAPHTQERDIQKGRPGLGGRPRRRWRTPSRSTGGRVSGRRTSAPAGKKVAAWEVGRWRALCWVPGDTGAADPPPRPLPHSPGQGHGNNLTRVQIASSPFVGSEGAPGSDSREGVTGLNDPVLCL